MKRPVVCFGLAFVFGEILGFVWQWLRVLIILIGIVFSVCSGRKRTHILERICFFILPVFVLWGSSRVLRALLEEQRLVAMAEEMPLLFEGKVLEINKEEKVVEIILESAVFEKGMKIRCLVSAEDMEDDALGGVFGNGGVREGVSECGSRFGVYGTIVVRGKSQLLEEARNPGCYDAYQVFRLENIYYQIRDCRIEGIIEEGPGWMRWLARLKECMQQVIDQSLSNDLAGILTGMVTGDKSGIPDEINSLYQSQGIAHILAISGLHVSMAGMGLREILKKMYVPFYTRQIVSIAVVFLYICMCGLSPSSIRAYIMFLAGAIGEMIGKTKDGASALSVAAMVILIREPLALFSFGFLMSFGCILSLLLMQNAHSKCAGVYITIVTMPLMAWFQYEISVYSVLLNMVVVPVMSVLFPMGLVGSLIGCLWLPIGKFLCAGAGVLLKLYEFLCMTTEKMPLSVVITGRPQIWKMVVIYGVLGMFYVISWWKKNGDKERNGSIGALGKMLPKRGCAWSENPAERDSIFVKYRYLLLLVMFLLFLRSTPDQMEVLFLDVGQGDCCVIRTVDGRTLMIDGGSTSQSEVGKYTISKVLKFYGISHIDYMVLSHMDEDHVNGALWLLENGWHVGQIELPGIVCNIDMRVQILKIAAKRNIPVSEIFAGDELLLSEGVYGKRLLESVDSNDYGYDGSTMDDQLVLTCLHPQKDFVADSDNAASAVIELVYGQCRFLFTGDVEGDGEMQMLEYLKACKLMNIEEVDIMQGIDVLKVAHHGSRNSTPEAFLNYVNPGYAVISCSENNIYGHPHEETLERLDEEKCITAVTAETGAVLVQSDGEMVRVQKYR